MDPKQSLIFTTSASENSAPRIGNYILGETLGKGTFGVVKQSTHIITGEQVAIKIIDKTKITSKSDRKRISNELKILRASKHTNIIKLYEILESTTHIYIVTEFASSGELYSLIINSQKIPEKEAVHLFRQIVHGLDCMHSLGFVHRDLKPENILLDHLTEIKIADFGLSNCYNHNELLKTSCGSPCYAPPEMIAGKSYKAQCVDIWGLGVVLYTMLSGVLPFEVSLL